MRAKAYSLALLAAALALPPSAARSQEGEPEGSNLSLGAGVYNRYIWRGLNLGGNTPSIQPSLGYAFGNSGLAVGAWGAFSVGGQTVQEIDLILSYTPVDMITLTLTDYFFPDDLGGYDYFDYRAETTGHLIEASVRFNGLEGFPLWALFAMNLHGDRTHATYLELGYPLALRGGVGLALFAGATLTDPGPGQAGFYGTDGPGLINLGITASKGLPITEAYALPISTSLIVNPYARRIFLTFGFTL